VELEASRVEVDVDIGVQHQVEMAQREHPPLEQRAVLEVRPAAFDRRAVEVRPVGSGGVVAPDVARVALSR